MDDWTEWALAARAGDRAAMRRFVEASQPHVWRLCAHLGSREAADDLTQETYMRALKALSSFRGEAPVRVWIFAIARRVVADDIAARRRRRRLHGAVASTVPRTHLDDHAEGLALESLLTGLGPERRESFVLTQVLGFSYADAAVIAECPVGTIRSRVARAREDLARALSADERSA